MISAKPYLEACLDSPEIRPDPYWIWSESIGYANLSSGTKNLAFIYECDPQAWTPSELQARASINPSERFGTFDWPLEQIELVCLLLRVGYFKRLQFCAARTGFNESSNTQVSSAIQNNATRSYSNEPVRVVGAIDSGFPILNDRLWPDNPQQDPLIGLWNQDEASSQLHAPWNAASLVQLPYGSELTAPALRQAAQHVQDQLPDYQKHGQVFEAACYEYLGFSHLSLGYRTHATGVLHVLAGPSLRNIFSQGFTSGFGTPIPYVLVELPEACVNDTSGRSMPRYMLDGVHYMIARARDYAGARKLNLVMNVSFGSIAGPHDGTTIIEQALDELCGDRFMKNADIKLVVSAGNTAGRQLAAEAKGQQKNYRFEFAVNTTVKQVVHFEFWVTDYSAQSPITFTLTSPTEKQFTINTTTHLAVEPVATTSSLPNGALVWAAAPCQTIAGSGKSLLLVSLEVDLDSNGIWELQAQANETFAIRGWAERNDVPGSAWVKQTTGFRPTETTQTSDKFILSHLAGGKNSIVATACAQQYGQASDYTAEPMLWKKGPNNTKPLYRASADLSATNAGLTIPGFFSGTISGMGGTSLAAPVLARALLDNAVQPNLSSALLKGEWLAYKG